MCVTGASGSIGSCLVQLLLARGYTVHGAVKNLSYFIFIFFQIFLRFHYLMLISCSQLISVAEDDKETKHLESLEGAESRLRLFQIDLLDYDSIAAAINGCAGVFHLASPCIVDQVHDPQVQARSLNPIITNIFNLNTRL